MEPIMLNGNQRAQLVAVLILMKSTLAVVGAVWPTTAQAMLELLKDGK